MAELRNLKRNRTLKISSINKNIVSNIDGLVSAEKDEETLGNIKTMTKTLKEMYLEVKDFDNKILNLIENDEELEKEVDETTLFTLKVNKYLQKLEDLSQRHTASLESSSNSQSVKYKSSETGVKLPKIVIKEFSGDATEWKSFLDHFTAAVDSKDSLTNIEKFTYLKGLLKGTALQAIEGFPLTNQNYVEAMLVLKERFGNPQLIVSSHMNNLIKLDKVTNSSVGDLRCLYDKIESNVRALSSVGISSTYFGPL